MPGHQLTDICKGCANFASCTVACKKLEKLLPEDLDKSYEVSPEIPFSDLRKKREEGDDASIDQFRKIDRSAIFRADSDQTVEWDAMTLEAFDLNRRDYKLLENYIDWRLLDKKQRQRFKAFLECEKMARIAAMANCSKQNIQKQFAIICRKVHKAIMKKRPLTHVITPHRFKMKYMELKPDTNP